MLWFTSLKRGVSKIDSLSTLTIELSIHGSVNFIARRFDGDDYARGFDIRQRYDDPLDFDATGSRRRSHAIAIRSPAQAHHRRRNERVPRRRKSVVEGKSVDLG